MARRTSNTVRAFGGEVESFTSAESSGIGVRVVPRPPRRFRVGGDARRGRRRRGARRRPRQRPVRRARRVGRRGRARRRRARAHRPVAAGAARACRRRRRSTWPSPSSVRSGRPTRGSRGVRSAAYGDRLGRGGRRHLHRHRRLRPLDGVQPVDPGAGVDGTATKTGVGTSVGREPAELSVDEAAADAVERATRLLGARKISSRRIPLVLEPRLAAVVLGHRRRDAHRWAGREGSIAVRRPPGRGDRLPAAHAGRRPDRPPVARRRQPRRRGPGHAPQRAHRGGRAPRLPARHLHRPPARPRPRPAPRSVAAARRRLPACRPSPSCRARVLPRSCCAASTAPSLVQSLTGLHSGVNAVSGDFSVGVEGLLVDGGELGQPVREVTVASHAAAAAARHRRRRRRPRVAPGRRRHPDHRDRRGRSQRRVSSNSSTPADNERSRAVRAVWAASK